MIVDPLRKVLTVLKRGDADYIGRELGPGESFRPRQLPGFELRVADLAL